MEYYFTFGSGGTQVHTGGYIIILASSRKEAQRLFIEEYGARAWASRGILNYAFDYDYDQWKAIDVNMGDCHNIIGLNTTDI